MEEFANQCESALEGKLIKIQTLGSLIWAANESKEMSDYNNSMAGYLVKDLGKEARKILNLKSSLEYYADFRRNGEVVG